MGDPEHVNAALHALFFVLIVCACLYCDFFIKKNQWFFFPESAASMVLGFVLGSLVVFSLSGIVLLSANVPAVPDDRHLHLPDPGLIVSLSLRQAAARTKW